MMLFAIEMKRENPHQSCRRITKCHIIRRVVFLLCKGLSKAMDEDWKQHKRISWAGYMHSWGAFFLLPSLLVHLFLFSD